MKRKITRLEWALFLSPILLIALVFAAQFNTLENIENIAGSLTGRDGRQRKHCSGNLQQLGVTFAQYSQDYDGKMPLAVIDGPDLTAKPGTFLSKPNRTVGWADALQIYPGKKSPAETSLYMCASDSHPPEGNPSISGHTDFYFNRLLSGVRRTSIKQHGQRLLLGEGNDGKDIADATYSKTAIPPAWLTDHSSPAFRHQGGANYLMMDGSVHWLKPAEIAGFGGRTDFFAIK